VRKRQLFSYTEHLEPSSPQTSQKDLEDSETQNDFEDLERNRRSPSGALDDLLDEYKEKFRQNLFGDIPLPIFMRLAAEKTEAEYDPTPDAWESTTWKFTRFLKGHPRLTCLDADEVFNLIPWEEFSFDEEEQMAFLTEWPRVHFIPGLSPLNWAIRMAKEKPLEPQRCREGNFSLYRNFVSLSGWLQILVGRGNLILLPVHKLPVVLGCSAKTVSNLRKVAEGDGFLEVVEKHTAKRATRFRFDVFRFQILLDWRQ